MQSGQYAQLQIMLSAIPELKDDDESIKEMRDIFMVGFHGKTSNIHTFVYRYIPVNYIYVIR